MDIGENINMLIGRAAKTGMITLHKFKYTGDGDEVEGEDYVLKHRGINITSEDIAIITAGAYKFLWIMNFEQEGKSYIYFADHLGKLMVESDEYDRVKGLPIVSINLEDKKYCIELTTNEFNLLYINFITTLPSGCNNKECERLRGLFTVLYKFLMSIKYTGPVSLKDDVQAGGEFVTIKRAMAKNPSISIYQRYGFAMSTQRYQDIMEAVDKKDKKKLEALARNIPMMARSIENFNQCVTVG